MTDKMFYEEVEKIRDGLIKKGVLKELPPQPSLGVIMTHTDEKHLDEIQDEVYTHLREQKVPATCRNIIQAMFELHYADWLGGEEILPTCPYEDCQANGL